MIKRWWLRRKSGFSIRDVVRANAIFYVILFVIVGTFSGAALYEHQRTQVDNRIAQARAEVEVRLQLETNSIRESLEAMRTSFEFVKLTPNQEGLRVFGDLVSEGLRRHPIQYNGYFALGRDWSRRYFGSDGMIFVTHRNPQLAGESRYYDPQTFLRGTYTESRYQSNPEEIWYTTPQTSRTVEWTDIYFDQNYMRRWMVSATLRLGDSENFYGMVGLDVVLDDLAADVEQFTFGETGSVLLVDTRTGRVLTRPRESAEGFVHVSDRYEKPSFEGVRAAQWTQILSGQPSPVCLTGADGREYFVSSQRLPGFPWAVVAFQERAEAFLPVYQQISALGIASLAGLLMLILVSARFARQINQPFGDLIETLVQNIRLAKKDRFLQVDLQAPRSSEVARVSRLVNRLIRALNRQTERHNRQVEEQRAKATHSARMASIGEMAANVAHEINSPLTAIGLNAEALESELARMPDLNPLIRHRVKVIRQVVDRIATTVRGLRNLSREGRQDPLVARPVGDLIQETLGICGAKLRNEGILLRQKGPSWVEVPCRSVQISQILLNLLNNAADAMAGQTEKWLEIEVRLEGGRVQIRVSDSGPGIPDEIRDRIMEPFFTTKDVGKGTGLGLSISRSIAEDHGGRLYLDSEDVVTCFVLELPTLEISRPAFSEQRI